MDFGFVGMCGVEIVGDGEEMLNGEVVEVSF